MKKILIKISKTTSLLLFCIIILISCTPEIVDQITAVALSTLRIILNLPIAKTLAPTDFEYDDTVVSYSLTATGPNNVIKKSNGAITDSITFLDLSPGLWSIECIGYNKNKEIILKGNNTLNLVKGDNTTVLSLDKRSTGAINLNIRWDSLVCPDAKLVIRLENEQTEEIKDYETISGVAGDMNFKEVLPIGGYIISAILFKDSTYTDIIEGCTEKAYVGSDKITSGELLIKCKTPYDKFQITIAPNSKIDFIDTYQKYLEKNQGCIGYTIDPKDTKNPITFPFVNDTFKSIRIYPIFESWDNIIQKALEITYLQLPNDYVLTEQGVNNFSNLKELILPNSISTICNKAFYAHPSLKKIKLSNLEQLPKQIFAECKELETLVIPESVKTIGEEAFYNSNIKTISIPSTVQVIGNGAFKNCTKMTKIDLAEGLKEIGSSAFYDCSALVELKIPDSVTTVGPDYTFYNVKGLKQIPLGAKQFGNNIFANSGLAGSIVIPKESKNVGPQAFHGCKDIKQVTIEEGVEVLEWGNFFEATQLTTVSLPSTLKKICGDPTLPNGQFGRSGLKEITIPFGCVFENGFTFFQCRNLESVTIQEGATTIPFSCFFGCKNLKNVLLPQSVTEILGCAFLECISLKTLELPNNLLYIDSKAFSNVGIEHLKVPKKVNFIGISTFDGMGDTQTIEFDIEQPLSSWATDWDMNCNANIIWKEYPSIVTLKPNETIVRFADMIVPLENIPKDCFVIGYRTKGMASGKSLDFPYTNTSGKEQEIYPIYANDKNAEEINKKNPIKGLFVPPDIVALNGKVFTEIKEIVFAEGCVKIPIFAPSEKLQLIKLPSTAKKVDINSSPIILSVMSGLSCGKIEFELAENNPNLIKKDDFILTKDGKYIYLSPISGDIVIPQGVVLVPELTYAMFYTIKSIFVPKSVVKYDFTHIYGTVNFEK